MGEAPENPREVEFGLLPVRAFVDGGLPGDEHMLATIRGLLDVHVRWAVASVVRHLPTFRSRVEAVPLEALNERGLRAVHGLLDPVRARLERSARGWKLSAATGVGAVAAAIAGVDRTLALCFGPLGAALIAMGSYNALVVQQMYAIASELCAKAGSALGERLP